MKKYLSGLFAIVLAVFTVAFTAINKNSVRKQGIKEWRYDFGSWRSAHSYTDVTGNAPTCSYGSIPCVITFDEYLYPGYTSFEKFQTFLDGFGCDAAFLIATEVTTKPED